MKTPLENVNTIYTVKIQLKNLLELLGMEPTDSFATYPQLFINKLQEINSQLDDIDG